jgi:hypothetical protein
VPSRSVILVLWVSVGAVACGDERAEPTDGTVPDGGSSTVAAPPDIPWLADGHPTVAPPSFLPCPAGWQVVTEGELSTCDPGADLGVSRCAVGEAHFPGESGCVPVGDACPAGDFSEGLPTDGSVVYVREGAVSGDGTRALPFGSLSDVSFGTLASGTTVALARGTYEGVLPLRAGVSVVGACAAETIITGLSAPVPAVVTVSSGGEPAVLRNLSIADSPQSGVEVAGAGRALSLEGVVVRGATRVGLIVEDGAEVTVTDVVVRDTRPEAGRFGRGVNVQSGGSVTLNRVVLEGNSEIALYASDSDSRVTAADAVFRDTRQAGADPSGRGLLIQLGATARLERVLVAGNHDLGLIAAGATTRIELDQVVVRGTEPASDGLKGGGIVAFEGATIEGSSVLVEDNHDVGVDCVGEGTSVSLSDLVVRDTQPRVRDDISGRGVIVELGAALVGARVVVARSHEIGIQVDGESSSATLADTVIRETLPIAADATFGMGLMVREGARAEGARVLVEESRVAGIIVDGASTIAVLEDVAVRDVESDEARAEFGRGINLQDGTLDASRVLVERTREAAIFVAGEGAHAMLSDIAVRDTRSQPLDDRGGAGLQTQDGGRATVSRAVIERSLGVGVVAIDGAAVTLEDVVVADTASRDCATTTCPSSPLGYGLATLAGRLSATRFVSTRAAICGVFVAEGELDLAMGEVTATEIGACIQSDGYDLMRLTNQVLYRDNGTNLDVTELPVPEAIGAIR